MSLKSSEGLSLGGSVERQAWPEAVIGVALWCLRRTEADEAVRAAAYGDGLAPAHADISLRLAEQAAENNVRLNKTGHKDGEQSKMNEKMRDRKKVQYTFCILVP